jgi:DNA-binding NtrC family response regulator
MTQNNTMNTIENKEVIGEMVDGKINIKNLNVLYLDDDQDVLDSYESMHRLDFNIYTTTNPMEARHIVATKNIHIIVTDQRMPYMTGLEFFKLIREEYPEPVRILLTGYMDLCEINSAVESKKIYSHVSKPFSPTEMRKTIEQAAHFYYFGGK